MENRVIMGSGVMSYVFRTDTVRFDIMVGQQWRGQVAFAVSPGIEYTDKELRAMTLMKRPSLKESEFYLLPTEQRV